MARIRKHKFTLLSSLRDVKNSKNSEEYSINFDKMLCIFMSPLLLLGAICIPLFSHFYLHRPLIAVHIDTIFMFMFAVIFELLLRLKIRQKLRHHLISMSYSLVLAFCILRFYSIVGPALFTFGVIQIILSLPQNSKAMLIYSSIGFSIPGIYVTFFQTAQTFQINGYYNVMQLILYILLYLVARAVYTIHKNHIKRLDENLNLLTSEILERKIAEEKNEYLALYDQLTGLPNRTLFCDRLAQSIEYATRNKLEIYILFVDIDLFKLINDSLGHTYGDELLVQIGARLSLVLRDSDAVCRVSGDEFLIMLHDVDDDYSISIVAERILKSIGTPFNLNNNHINISCSIGISKFPENGSDVETLIKYSDIAMYKSKREGKNRFTIYSSDLEIQRNNEMEIVNALQEGLNNNEFRLHYQPQVNGNTKEVIGFEALIRWDHPTRGFLGAGEIIPLAEKSGLIVPIGEWVLKTACRQNKLWQDEGMDPVPMAVNISIKQITSNSLYDLVKNTLQETGLDPKYLELEITETMLVKETEIVNTNLKKIRELGVKIAIDDFGTGYSAIQYLKSFPIDRIKIPINFIKGIDVSEKDESIITVILALAESLGIGVVAEGVETINQLDFLTDRLCSTIQGYFFSKPMPADAAASYANGN